MEHTGCLSIAITFIWLDRISRFRRIALRTLLFLMDMVNSTLMFSFSCCYISLDRHNFPSMTHFLLPCSIIHISHHMECIFMSENIFSKICLISSLPISACFHTYLWPHVHFLPVLRSLFSDKLASSLQTRRRPVRFLPSSPVCLDAFMPPSRIWHTLILSCGGILYRLHFLLRFSNCSAATVDPSHRHVGIIYVNRNSPAELSHACRHVYALHLFRVCGTSWGGKHVVRLCNGIGACWPVFLDRHSIPVVCTEAFSIFDHSYLIIRVLRFLCFHAPFLSTSWSTFGHVLSRGYVSMSILFPRIGDSMTIFAPASIFGSAVILLTLYLRLKLFVTVSLRWYRLWHLAAVVGFCSIFLPTKIYLHDYIM